MNVHRLQALGKCKDDNLTCVLHKNAAASHLKLKEFDEAIKHCDLGMQGSMSYENDFRDIFVHLVCHLCIN